MFPGLRRRYPAAPRLGLFGAATLATLLASGALSGSPAVARGSGARTASASSSCPWVTSRASIAKRVSQVLAHMTLSDEITMVEGHGSSNPYVF